MGDPATLSCVTYVPCIFCNLCTLNGPHAASRLNYRHVVNTELPKPVYLGYHEYPSDFIQKANGILGGELYFMMENQNFFDCRAKPTAECHAKYGRDALSL